MDDKQISSKIKKIPPSLIPEVLEYIDLVLKKHSSSMNKKTSFNFSWEGGLSDLANEFNAVDLQHKSLEWR